MSLVEVLPTDPVTPTTLAAVRARAARARSDQGRQNIGHDQQRGSFGHALGPMGDKGCRGALAPARRPRNHGRRAHPSAPRTDRPASACGCRSTRPPPARAPSSCRRWPQQPPASPERGHISALQCRDRDAGLFHIVEGIDVAGDGLPRLMALCLRSAAHRPGQAHRRRAGSPRPGRRPRSPRGSHPEWRRGSRPGLRSGDCRR